MTMFRPLELDEDQVAADTSNASTKPSRRVSRERGVACRDLERYVELFRQFRMTKSPELSSRYGDSEGVFGARTAMAEAPRK